MVIRPATKSDANELMLLRTHLYKETSFLLWEPEEYNPTIATEERFIEALMTPENSHLFLAFIDGSLIGFLAVAGGYANRIRHNADIFLGVKKSHWRKKVATRLFKTMFIWLKDSPLHRLELTTGTNNQAAFELYKSMGFQLDCVKKQYVKVDGRFCDEYQMSYVISCSKL